MWNDQLMKQFSWVHVSTRFCHFPVPQRDLTRHSAPQAWPPSAFSPLPLAVGEGTEAGAAPLLPPKPCTWLEFLKEAAKPGGHGLWQRRTRTLLHVADPVQPTLEGLASKA